MQPLPCTRPVGASTLKTPLATPATLDNGDKTSADASESEVPPPLGEEGLEGDALRRASGVGDVGGAGGSVGGCARVHPKLNYTLLLEKVNADGQSSLRTQALQSGFFASQTLLPC